MGLGLAERLSSRHVKILLGIRGFFFVREGLGFRGGGGWGGIPGVVETGRRLGSNKVGPGQQLPPLHRSFNSPRGSTYTTITCIGPQNHNADGTLGPNSLQLERSGASTYGRGSQTSPPQSPMRLGLFLLETLRPVQIDPKITAAKIEIL